MSWIDGVRQKVASGLPDGVVVGDFLDTEHAPVGLWDLNHILTDRGSGGKPLTKHGSPEEARQVYLPSDKFYSFGAGNGLYLSNADTIPYFTTGDISIVVLHKHNSATGAYQGVFGFRDGPYSAYQWWGTYGDDFEYWQATTRMHVVPSFFVNGEWCVYAFVRESGVHRAFRDGVQIGSDSAVASTPSASVEKLIIGGAPDGSYVDSSSATSQVGLFHGALTPKQIQAITNTLKPAT